ncbi:MAG: bifunctional methylenetetrahydrofolate dehydrogenase/methenyltetrahydrofolate cyclohydrolase FolD [Firmicutes bacterium]|nr:bifunctional methylenetetrahydrofolate dehydrogenase/methenyltetrahydrofolate cyclohydrolase FolD [Bacillota bacterium]
MILDGKMCSSKLKEALKNEVVAFPSRPKIIDIQIGENAASEIYIRNKGKAANSVGIDFDCVRFGVESTEDEIINKIKELNEDETINGILVQMPIPDKYDYKKIINTINPSKDVDGLTYVNSGKLLNGEDGMVSCTPAGIIELLKFYNIDIASKNVVIIGRSILVGKPLSMLFLKENATVTVCHSKTSNLSYFTKNADILVVAVGKKHLITKDMVKENSVIIDVGINRVDDKIYGDVDLENVKDIATITPVPGGVGPMTVTMLLYNTVKNYKENQKKLVLK